VIRASLFLLALSLSAFPVAAGQHFTVTWSISADVDRITLRAKDEPPFKIEEFRDLPIGRSERPTSDESRVLPRVFYVLEEYDFARQQKIIDKLLACGEAQDCAFLGVDKESVLAAAQAFQNSTTKRFGFECWLYALPTDNCLTNRFGTLSGAALSDTPNATYSVEWSTVTFPPRNALQRRLGLWPGLRSSHSFDLSIWPNP